MSGYLELYLEWRYSDIGEPAWLMANGKLVGEWDPKTGAVTVKKIWLLDCTRDEKEARAILEGYAKRNVQRYCVHSRLNTDGVCFACGADCR